MVMWQKAFILAQNRRFYSNVLIVGKLHMPCPHLSKVANFPNVSSLLDERYVSEIMDGTLIGYRYFDFTGKTKLKLRISKSIRYYEYDELFGDQENKTAKKRKLVSIETNRDSKETKAQDGYFEIFQSIIGTGFETEEEKKIEAGKGFTAENPASFRIDVKADYFSGEDAYEWQEISLTCDFKSGVYPLFFKYHGDVVIDLLEFELE